MNYGLIVDFQSTKIVKLRLFFQKIYHLVTAYGLLELQNEIYYHTTAAMKRKVNVNGNLTVGDRSNTHALLKLSRSFFKITRIVQK